MIPNFGLRCAGRGRRDAPIGVCSNPCMTPMLSIILLPAFLTARHLLFLFSNYKLLFRENNNQKSSLQKHGIASEAFGERNELFRHTTRRTVIPRRRYTRKDTITSWTQVTYEMTSFQTNECTSMVSRGALPIRRTRHCCVGGTSACATGHTSSSTFLPMPSPVSHIGDRFLHGSLTQDVGILFFECCQNLSTPACSSGLFNDWIRQASLALQAATHSRYDNATLNHRWTRVLSSTHISLAIIINVQPLRVIHGDCLRSSA